MKGQTTTEYLLSLGEVVLFSLIVAGAIVGIGYLAYSFGESEKKVLWEMVP